MAEKKRSLVAGYINSTPSATADTWELMGLGIDSFQVSYNPQTDTKQYINQDSATTRVTGYQPNGPITQKVYPGDDLFDFVDGLRQSLSIDGDDVTEYVEVRLYETPATDGVTYPATKWTVQIQYDTAPGGDGGADAEMGYTLLFQGDPVDGDFNTSTLAFTPTP